MRGSAARLEKPFLRTSARLTVAHLKRYLAKRTRLTSGKAAGGVPAATHIEIFCRGKLLGTELSLETIAREHWGSLPEDLVLNYMVHCADAEM